MRTLYLLFSEGYKASSGDRLMREDLCNEAIRLTLLLARYPGTAEPRVHALLALMMLSAARLPARSDDAGNLLRLHKQNRAAWDFNLIQSGIRHLGLATSGDSISVYHLEAGIAACHSTAADDASTDWPRILFLYEKLMELNPSPVTAMNRAVAVARVHGPLAGLEAISSIRNRGPLESHHLYHAIRGSLTAELGDTPTALAHFRQVEKLAQLPAEREFIARRIKEC